MAIYTYVWLQDLVCVVEKKELSEAEGRSMYRNLVALPTEQFDKRLEFMDYSAWTTSMTDVYNKYAHPNTPGWSLPY